MIKLSTYQNKNNFFNHSRFNRTMYIQRRIYVFYEKNAFFYREIFQCSEEDRVMLIVCLMLSLFPCPILLTCSGGMSSSMVMSWCGTVAPMSSTVEPSRLGWGGNFSTATSSQRTLKLCRIAVAITTFTALCTCSLHILRMGKRFFQHAKNQFVNNKIWKI